VKLSGLLMKRACGRLGWLTLGVVVLWGAAGAWGAKRGSEEKLPTGKEIVERYLEVAGGREAMEKIDNRRLKATLLMEQMGIEGTTVITQARPNLYHARIEIPGVMTVESGSNGEVAWEVSSITGPRVIEGEEKGMMLWTQRFDDTTYEEDMKSVECVGMENVKDKPCYKVVMAPRESRPFNMYFSKKSGLPVKVELVFAHMFGDIQVESWIGDFREVDGILYPHSAIQSVMGNEMKTTITDVEHDVELPSDQFQIPAEVEKLLVRAAERKTNGTEEKTGEEADDQAAE